VQRNRVPVLSELAKIGIVSKLFLVKASLELRFDSLLTLEETKHCSDWIKKKLKSYSKMFGFDAVEKRQERNRREPQRADLKIKNCADFLIIGNVY
jgi:hypothetical protein